MVLEYVGQPLEKQIYIDCSENLDFSKGIKIESPFESDKISCEKMCIRKGYSIGDINKSGFACIITDEEHIKSYTNIQD